jgi:hypothetical protein
MGLGFRALDTNIRFSVLHLSECELSGPGRRVCNVHTYHRACIHYGQDTLETLNLVSDDNRPRLATA